jgi:glycosyltransferase involved in cell wall biosynthesis
VSVSLSIVINTLGAEPSAVARALESTGAAVGAQEVLLLGGDLDDAALQRAIGPHQANLRHVPASGLSRGEARNAAVAAAQGRYLVIVDPGERLAPDALERHVTALDGADAETVASYGRTAIHRGVHVRLRPDHGRGGQILKRLVKDKYVLASSACVVWRREALLSTPFPHFESDAAARLGVAVELSRRGGAFAFHPAVVAERDLERLDPEALHELVKIFLGLLYAPEPLPEKLEQRVRFRLARHLVAIGKHHYRGEDFKRAGSFFDQAVKAVPNYFKGRRYQFLNFVKRKVTERP